MDSTLPRPDQLVALYGILNRIQLISGDHVVRTAEACCLRIVEHYRQPNMTSDDIHMAFQNHQLDLLKEFSATCRAELLAMAFTD